MPVPPSPCLGVRDAAGDAGSSPCNPQILVANDNACQLLGYSSHDLIGQKLTQFFLKPDSDVVEALSEEHLEADGHAAVVFGTVVSAGLGRWPALSVPLGARRRRGWHGQRGCRPLLHVGVGSSWGRHQNRGRVCWPGALPAPGRMLVPFASLQGATAGSQKTNVIYCPDI